MCENKKKNSEISKKFSEISKKFFVILTFLDPQYSPPSVIVNAEL